MRFRVLTVFGTRPEAIKLVPVIRALASEPGIESMVCITSQHKEMLTQVLNLFAISADFDLDVMRPGQELTVLVARMLEGLQAVISTCKPDLVLVHGDTCSCFAGALAAFYNQVPIAHIEAGLRTANISAPFPEEAHRQLVSRIANLHFAPTSQAAKHLQRECLAHDSIHVTGNTVVDMVRLALQQLQQRPKNHFINALSEDLVEKLLSEESRTVLITLHRRELSGDKFLLLCEAIGAVAVAHPEWSFVYPVHLNPDVREPAYELLGGIANIYLLEPRDYLTFLWLMLNCNLVVTDSGGVQEEAEILGKPLMVVRDQTDRPESLDRDGVRLAGTDATQIHYHFVSMLSYADAHRNKLDHGFPASTLYGDGYAAQKIVKIIKQAYVDSWRSQHRVAIPELST
jgi:UDP-N-acetylglucosamine 2-epimerase (non-hydrolysing)